MKAKTVAAILFAAITACFGEDKTPAVAIDCRFQPIDFVKLNLRGYSNAKVPPEKLYFGDPSSS